MEDIDPQAGDPGPYGEGSRGAVLGQVQKRAFSLTIPPGRLRGQSAISGLAIPRRQW
jgi:hypothetical protein